MLWVMINIFPTRAQMLTIIAQSYNSNTMIRVYQYNEYRLTEAFVSYQTADSYPMLKSTVQNQDVLSRDND